jgi:hypothetical protein
MEGQSTGVLECWSTGVLRIKYAGFQQPSLFSSFFHYSNTPFFFTPLLHHSIIPLLHFFVITPLLQFFYIPSTWHTNVITAVATMILTMLVTTAEVAAYPTAEALLSHCIPRRHPERATKTPNTAL